MASRTRYQQYKAGVRGLESWWAILRDAASGWISHKAGQLGASLAYYSIFSIGPLLLVTLSVAGMFYDQAAARGAISAQLQTLLGAQAASTVENMLVGAGKPSEGIFATLLGLVTLIFGAIGVVVQLKEALNTVFDAQKTRTPGLWGFVQTYAVSFAGIVSLGFLLLVSMILSAILSAAGSLVQTFMPEFVMQLLATVVSFLVTSALFAAMFKWLPDTETAWTDVVPGAILTAALFEVGRFLVGFYIGKQGLESTYGGAASLVVLLLWVYYTSQIVLFGAEFVRAHSRSSTPRTSK
jgi:membrane protein